MEIIQFLALEIALPLGFVALILFVGVLGSEITFNN